ncbi:MAG: porin [Pseudomonadota bacterium]
MKARISMTLRRRSMAICRPTSVAAALLLGATPWALAQDSNVQVFGSLAVSVLNLSNQATGGGSRMVAGPWTAPSWGLRGSESLGDGLNVTFRLESSVEGDSGTGGRTVLGTHKTFDKASWVGIGNQTFNLTMGRQLHAGIDRIAETMDVFYANADGKLLLSVLALNATNTFGGFDTRGDQVIKLRAQLPAGFKAGLSVAPAIAGRFGRSSSLDVGQQTASYGVGAYLLNHHSSTTQLRQRTWGLGGNLALGGGRVFAHYMNAEHDKSAGGATRQSDRVLGLGVAYPVTAALTVRAAYYQDRGSDVGGVAGRDGKRQTTAVMGDYAFSKRTSLNFGVFNNSLSGAFAADPTSLSVLGLINPATMAISGNSMRGLAVGLNHRF